MTLKIKCYSCQKEKECILYGNSKMKIYLCPDCINESEMQFKQAKLRGRIKK